MFLVSIGEEGLQNELTSCNSSMSPQDFLEDVFSTVVSFSEQAVESVAMEPEPVLVNEDLFTPPVGLEVEDGAEIAKRKVTTMTRKSNVLPKSRIFKVRELSGKRAMIKKGNTPKKKVIKRKKSNKSKIFKPVPKEEPNKIEAFLKPVLECDLFSVKEFWGKASELNYSEFTTVVKKITDETVNNDSRIRATAITALASIASGVSWEMPAEVMDRALILTGDGSKEVRDAAVEAINEMGNAGVDKVPQFKPAATPEITQTSNDMELGELGTDSMLGEDSGSIGSLSLGSGSGGVKMMGGENAVIDSGTTFEIPQGNQSLAEEPKDNPPKFKAVKDNTPKFKPAGKKAPKFKIAKE